MKLTTKGRYAVSAMLDLALHNGSNGVVLRDISKRCNVSLSYLEQLFSKMRRARIVESLRGPGGGYRIVRKYDTISIAEIVRSVDENLEVRSCQGDGNCLMHKNADGHCNTHALWDKLTKHIYEYLELVTLQDLCNQTEEKRNELIGMV